MTNLQIRKTVSENPVQLTITSSAFDHEATIPKKYTREGEDKSPPLNIKGTPIHVQSLAIIVDDPDAPLGDFVHWVTWNIDPDLTKIEEGIKLDHEGLNDFGDKGYSGPYPPKGRPHRYCFKAFALDARLNLPEKTLKADLIKAMKHHVLAQGKLIGIFERK